MGQENQNHTAPAPDMALRVENLQYKIGLISILKGIQFELRPGEILALLGPNGAGKSTLLKCLAGLLPHAGRSEVFGSNLKRNYALKQKIGYLGHESFLYSKLSALENLRFYSGLYGTSTDLDALLQEYLLSDSAEQLVETFSRGMKQRLALARAMLARPELVLLDEPFTGLDQQSSSLLEKKIRELKGKVTFVIATHELQRAYELSDQLLILKNGRQAFYASKTQIDTEISELYRSKTL